MAQNEDATAHRLAAHGSEGAFELGELAEGDTQTMRFDQPGTIVYHCDLHPAMTGSITVDADRH